MVLPARHHGRLALELGYKHGRTTIVRQRSRPPLQIFGLQYGTDGRSAYLQIVNPCGGLFAGDTAEIEISLQPGGHLYLTTQAATKVYPATHGEVTRQRIRFRVAPNAILEYFPLPLIPFAHAEFAQDSGIWVEAGGVCMVAEVLSPGRLAHGERFAYHRVRSSVTGWVGSQLVLFDQMRLEPHRGAYDGLGLLEGQPCLATLCVLTSQPLAPRVAAWNERLQRRYDGRVGIAELVEGGLRVRVLGHTSQEVLRSLEDVSHLIREEGLGLPPLQVYRPFA